MSCEKDKREGHHPENSGASARSWRAVRWAAAFGVLAGLAVGVAGAYFLASARTTRPTSDDGGNGSAVASSTTAPNSSPAAAAASFIEPPYPTNADELRADVTRVVDTLAARLPNSLDCLELKARLAEWLGRREEARRLWEQCLDKDPRFSHALYGLAKLAARNGDLERSLELSQRAIQSDPGYFLARLVAAETLLHLDRPQEVVELLKDYLAVDPRSQGAFLLGQAYFRLGQFDEAVHAYRMAVTLFPGHAEAYSAMVPALVRLGKKDEAAEALKQARALRNTQADGRPSRKSLREDLELMFDNAARLYGDAGRIYLAHGLRHEAERVLRRAAVVSPRDAGSRFALAALYADAYRMSEAISLLDQVAVAHDQDVDTLLALARSYTTFGALEKAEKVLQRACEVAPRRADVWFHRAEHYVSRNERIEDAVAFARRAVELAPTARRYALLAAACDQAGDTAEAVKAIDRAVELAPESTVYQQVQQELKTQLSNKP